MDTRRTGYRACISAGASRGAARWRGVGMRARRRSPAAANLHIERNRAEAKNVAGDRAQVAGQASPDLFARHRAVPGMRP